MKFAKDGQSQQSDRTSDQPTTQVATNFGLSEQDLSILHQQAQKAFREALNPRIQRTIDAFLAKQSDEPIQFTRDDAIVLSARYCEAVRQGAARFAQELGEAIGNRRGLGTEELQWMESQIDAFIGGFMSQGADYLAAKLMSNLTIANGEEATQRLSICLPEFSSTGLLTKESRIALDLALARHGTHRRTPNPSDFQKTPDYRSVSFRGTQFSFTSRQAQVVQMLYEAFINGTPEVGQDHILEELGSPNSRLRDSFKKSRAWNFLIVGGESRGTYRLNLPDPPPRH